MMTAQEAIERLTAIVEFCSGGRENATLHGKPLSQEDEEIRQLNFSALELAISALEEQIGKKPHKNYQRLSDVWCDCGWYLGRYSEGKNYCGNCGQAICWDATDVWNHRVQQSEIAPEPFDGERV